MPSWTGPNIRYLCCSYLPNKKPQFRLSFWSASSLSWTFCPEFMRIIYRSILSTCHRASKSRHLGLPKTSRHAGRRERTSPHSPQPPGHQPTSNAAALLSIAASMQAGPEPPSLLTIAAIVAGLPIALWTYKSMMMVLFQRRIIYMGYAPLGARTEKLSEPMYARSQEGLNCAELTIHNAEDDVALSGLLVTKTSGVPSPKVVVVYFQGNAGNPLHRLPVFQALLRATRNIPKPQTPTTSTSHHDDDLAVLAVAPRSYWTSTKKRPTQQGILSDYRCSVNYALERFPDAKVVLYGHSLGGAAAVCLLAEHDREMRHPGSGKVFSHPDRIHALVLENPFSSIAGMVRALYPQRWVPYQYLTRFLFDRWDALEAMQATCSTDSLAGSQRSLLQRLSRSMLVMVSEHDEIVPRSMGESLFGSASKDSGGNKCKALLADEPAAHDPYTSPRLVVVLGALHENAWRKWVWEKEMRGFLGRYL